MSGSKFFYDVDECTKNSDVALDLHVVIITICLTDL